MNHIRIRTYFRYYRRRLVIAHQMTRWIREVTNFSDPTFRPPGEWVDYTPRSDAERQRWMKSWRARRAPRPLAATAPTLSHEFLHTIAKLRATR
jgi:hypothetical protein